MTTTKEVALAGLAALFVFAGCAGARLSDSAGPPALSRTRVLPAAEGEEDEFGVLLEEPKPVEPAPAPAPQPAPEPKEREWRAGLRAGLLVTGPTEEAWNAAFFLGGYYRGSPLKRLVYELGVDLATVESDDGSTTSQLLFLRGEVLLGKWNPEEEGTSFYALAGAQGISEQAKLNGSGKTEPRMGASINLGVGLGSVKGAWDARVVYSVVVGSDNAKGSILAAAGFSF